MLQSFAGLLEYTYALKAPGFLYDDGRQFTLGIAKPEEGRGLVCLRCDSAPLGENGLSGNGRLQSLDQLMYQQAASASGVFETVHMNNLPSIDPDSTMTLFIVPKNQDGLSAREQAKCMLQLIDRLDHHAEGKKNWAVQAFYTMCAQNIFKLTNEERAALAEELKIDTQGPSETAAPIAREDFTP